MPRLLQPTRPAHDYDARVRTDSSGGIWDWRTKRDTSILPNVNVPISFPDGWVVLHFTERVQGHLRPPRMVFLVVARNRKDADPRKRQ
jgi:hypothetical protein